MHRPALALRSRPAVQPRIAEREENLINVALPVVTLPIKRLLAMVLMVALAVGLTHGTSTATPTMGNHLKMGAAVAHETNRLLHSPWDHASARIVGFQRSGRYWVRVLRARPDPVAVQGPVVPGQSRVAMRGAPVTLPGGQVIYPDSWFNPLSWHWSNILGTVWNNIVLKCAKGAAKGLVGTASGTLITNLLIRGAKLYVGPYGYAAMAIGGCSVDVLFQ